MKLEKAVKKVFVTGGTGFIGEHTVDLLANDPQIKLYVLTRASRSDKENIRYIQGNIDDDHLLRGIMQNFKPDTLLHLAWDIGDADVINSKKNYQWVLRSKRLIEVFLKGGGHRVISAGTGVEYDISKNILHREDEECFPSSVYGKCKLEVLKYFQSLCKIHGANFIWGRIFYAYGKDEHPRKIISMAKEEILHGRSFVCKNPNQILDYIHVNDIARYFALFVQNESISGIINVCSGKGLRLRDILTELANEYKAREKIIFLPNGDNMSLIGDNSKIKKLCGECQISLSKGIKLYR